MNIDYLLKRPAVLATVGAGVVVLIAVGGFFYFRSTQAPKTTPQSPQQAQEEVKKLVLEVGKLVELPQGEDPTVATVTDVNKLKDQPFFAKAKNGDKVLIYTNARKAYLYSPALKKILDVAPINLGTPSGQLASPSPSPKASPKASPTATPR